mmetsp:Transcript_655/g.1514  ORF Transcript_655/g.1514 Transcript_655/m.1514 type:complete len:609 (+) Transcript_655:1344-3170(+)
MRKMLKWMTVKHLPLEHVRKSVKRVLDYVTSDSVPPHLSIMRKRKQSSLTQAQKTFLHLVFLNCGITGKFTNKLFVDEWYDEDNNTPRQHPDRWNSPIQWFLLQVWSHYLKGLSVNEARRKMRADDLNHRRIYVGNWNYRPISSRIPAGVGHITDSSDEESFDSLVDHCGPAMLTYGQIKYYLDGHEDKPMLVDRSYVFGHKIAYHALRGAIHFFLVEQSGLTENSLTESQEFKDLLERVKFYKARSKFTFFAIYKKGGGMAAGGETKKIVVMNILRKILNGHPRLMEWKNELVLLDPTSNAPADMDYDELFPLDDRHTAAVTPIIDRRLARRLGSSGACLQEVAGDGTSKEDDDFITMNNMDATMNTRMEDWELYEELLDRVKVTVDKDLQHIVKYRRRPRALCARSKHLAIKEIVERINKREDKFVDWETHLLLDHHGLPSREYNSLFNKLKSRIAVDRCKNNKCTIKSKLGKRQIEEANVDKLIDKFIKCHQNSGVQSRYRAWEDQFILLEDVKESEKEDVLNYPAEPNDGISKSSPHSIQSDRPNHSEIGNNNHASRHNINQEGDGIFENCNLVSVPEGESNHAHDTCDFKTKSNSREDLAVGR